MFKIQPQSIVAESADRYLVRFERDSAPLEYSFSVDWTGDIGILNCDQREFYFETHDDPATKHLLKTIDLFDEIQRRETGSNKLKSMSAVQDKEDSYTVIFRTTNADCESHYSIFKSSEGRLVPMLTSPVEFSEANSDCILELINSFHKARCKQQ